MIQPLTEKQISDKILACGIRPSFQRVKILNYLYKNRLHPTAEKVYEALSPEILTLSRTTVYNTLKLFIDNGLVQSLTIDGDEMRYDADTSHHVHFKCNCCGNVLDMLYPDTEFEYDKIISMLPAEFTVNKIQTFIWGTCSDCKKK